MCGLVTLCSFNRATTLKLDHKKYFQQALIADTFRGKDSTGIFAVPHSSNEPVDIFKKALTAYDFVDTNMYQRFNNNFNNYKFIVGHNRWSTKGASNTTNAHPFQHGDITLVHNGTVNSHNLLIKGKESFTVDSEAICFAINERGAEVVIPEISGAFALIWHDAKDDTINFARNSERPFYMAKLQGEDTLVGASELKMLEWICDRNNILIDKPFLLKTKAIVSFKSTFKAPSSIIKVENIVPYTAPMSSSSHYYEGGSVNNTNIRKEKEKFTKEVGLKEKDVIEFIIDKIDIPQGHLVRTCKVFGTYTNKLTHKTYPVRNYSIPSKGIKNLKKGSKAVAFVSDFYKNSDRTHVSKQPYYISISNLDSLAKFSKDFPISVKTKQMRDREIEKKAALNIVSTHPQTRDLYYGPKGMRINAKTFKDMTQDGCVICTGNILHADHQETTWTSDSQPICKDCAITTAGREYADSHYAIM